MARIRKWQLPVPERAACQLAVVSETRAPPVRTAAATLAKVQQALSSCGRLDSSAAWDSVSCSALLTSVCKCCSRAVQAAVDMPR